MKTTFISCSSLLLVSMFIFLDSGAQKTGNKNEPSYPSSFYKISNTFPSGSDATMSNPGDGNISEKVLKGFYRIFGNATNTKWAQIDDKFVARFSIEGTSTSSLFNKKGKMIYSVNYCSDKQLPSGVKNMITDQYENYIITSVSKVSQDNRKIWVVKLAGNFRYITARVEDGEMEEVENFQKSN